MKAARKMTEDSVRRDFQDSLVLRKLKESDVEFTISVDYEDLCVEESFEDTPDGKAMVKEIKERMGTGDVWAWCSIKVSATWKGFKGWDCLGGCSYYDQEDFESDGGYYPQMKAEALDKLNEEIALTFDSIKELIK